MLLTPVEKAAVLVATVGPPDAWQTATREAIDAHLAHDDPMREFWKEVQQALARTAPRPGPGDLDIYRTARLLISEHGSAEAERVAWQRAVELEGDLLGQTVWSRVADAVAALAQDRPSPSETLQ